MNAQAWHWQEKGEPESLVLKETWLEEPDEDEVLIQNTFIGLNPVDWKSIVAGHPAWEKDHVPGVDGAGIVVKTGAAMNRIPLGTRVCYHASMVENGSFSTHTLVKGNALLFVPPNVSDAAAAAFPCPSLTAWQAVQKIPVLSNQDVLVNGAGGSVGYFLTQLLIEKGARVYVTASEEHHDELYKMGVFKAVNYKTDGWKDLISESLHGKLLDVVFDSVSGLSAAGLMDLLGYYGHIVSIQDRVKQNPLRAFTTCISIHEIALGAFHKFATNQQIANLMADGEKLLQEIGNGKLSQRPLKIADFNQLNLQLQEMKNHTSSTKYVVKV